MFGLKKHHDGRINPRWRMDRFLGVYDEDKSVFLGRVEDLSLSGMCVISDETLPVGHHVRLALEALQDDGSIRTHFVRCRCVWARPDSEEGLVRIGLEFAGVSHTVIGEIDRIIRAQRLAHLGAPAGKPPR